MPQKGNLESLIATIQEKAKDKKHFVIVLSGFGGAGKSTTSKEMLKILEDATIIPLDKFIVNRLAERSEGWDEFDWERLIEQVLKPIKNGEETIKYGIYDWFENKIVSDEEVKIKKYVIVEGVGLIRDSLEEYFDFSVWIDVPLDVASKRAVKRDKEEYGVDHDKFWAEIWQPNDKDYFEKYQPMENCDFILLNNKKNKKTPIDRLNYTGDIGPVIERLCESCNVGKPTSFSVIGIGYDDCNVIIETSGGKYVAKMFSKERDQESVDRYVTIMQKALATGVNHPPLIKTSDGGVVYADSQASGISMVLMKFIKGKAFLELGRTPDEKELRAVIEQAARINRIEHHPSCLSDSWAVPNIKAIFERVKQFIQPEDLKLVEQVIALYAEIPVESLPHSFVHGDFTKANVMKGDDGKIYVLDFSVSNWYPRIQELAVIAANLLHKDDNSLPLRKRTELVIAEYEKFIPLTPEEKQYLYAYALAGIAMEFMGGHQEKFINGNISEETEYWINLGRNGLRKELAN